MKQGFYWLVTKTKGKTALFYGGSTEKGAYDKGHEILDSSFEVLEIPTRDMYKAVKIYKILIE